VPNQADLAELALDEPLTGDVLVVVNQTPMGEIARFALLSGAAPQATDPSMP
jgi:hypothetical protein